MIDNYELIDTGDGRKLENFSGVIVDRPAPQATWTKSKSSGIWNSADISFEKNKGWNKQLDKPDWLISPIDGITLKLKQSSQGQVGIFPEQYHNWLWLREVISSFNEPQKILNGFAYTGGSTLAAASASDNLEICHLDSSSAAISWAKENIFASNLQHKKVRWIKDDVLTFLDRESRRSNKYNGFIMDPPTFGRCGKIEWLIERDLPLLTDRISQLINSDNCFTLLSCHSSGISCGYLIKLLKSIKNIHTNTIECEELIIKSSSGRDLNCGISARFYSIDSI